MKPERAANPPLSLHAWLRYDTIRRLLRRVDARDVLEIGFGQGSVGVLLARRFDYTGVDLDGDSYATAESRFRRYDAPQHQLLHGGLELVAGRQFDLVCAFEVLEHLADDAAALAEWRTHVKPGGWLCVSVPAGPDRMGPTDEKAGHYRRYDRDGLTALLRQAGFSDVAASAYAFPVGYALEAGRNVYARRVRDREPASYEERTLASGRWLQPPDWAASVMAAAAVPFRIMQRPFPSRGTGLVALGRLNANS